MKKTKNNVKKIMAMMLSVSLLSSVISVSAAEEKEKFDNVEFSYVNEDAESIKNANISEEEAKNARLERMKDASDDLDDLDYDADIVHVEYNRSKAMNAALEMGLKDEFELYKADIHSFGNDGIERVLMSTTKSLWLIIDLNDNKTVATAIKEYQDLDYVEKAVIQPHGHRHTGMFEVKGIYPIYNSDSITLGCVVEDSCPRTKYRWEYCKIGESTWHTISDWKTSEWCTWYPDANEEYAVVCKVYDNAIKEEQFQSIWYVSRPQMNKKVTGKCAMPTDDGLLFGCTSNVGKNDKDYYTTCYIWSHDQQAWITQSSYQASDCAWFKVSSLPKGTYMMYTCTEKMMPNGQKRKLSCDYYLFSN